MYIGPWTTADNGEVGREFGADNGEVGGEFGLRYR